MTNNIKNEGKAKVNKAPSAFKIISDEILHDKFALVSLFTLITIFLFIFISTTFFLDQKQIMRVDLFSKYARPGAKFILGADMGGRSIMGQLIIGAKNSILIGVSVTILTSFIGLVIGLTIGYYGGIVDNIVMRIIDFKSILPVRMIIIVFVSIVTDYNMITFTLIMSAFYWTGTARVIRSKTLSEARRDYVSASKTMGTSNLVIMFREILPNISTIVIVNITLNFAANLGIETGLSFLGFGLPPSTPSIGTLLGYARNPEVISDKLFVWVPASLLLLVLMLCINYIGGALKRASDSKQRLA